MKQQLNETLPEHLQGGISVEINEPFRGISFIANKKLKPEDIEKLEQTLPREEQLQFVI